jgi:hypothetical protein
MALSSSLTLRKIPANALVGDLSKPAFDQIQPGTVSGREVDMETGSFGKPVPDDGCLVGSIIVHDNVDREPRGYVGLDGAEKFPEFLRTVTPAQLPEEATGLQFQCGEQGGSAVPFIVVGTPFDLARASWQHGLSAIQCLNLALFVHADHHRMIRRVHVKAHNVAHLCDKQWIR